MGFIHVTVRLRDKAARLALESRRRQAAAARMEREQKKERVAARHMAAKQQLLLQQANSQRMRSQLTHETSRAVQQASQQRNLNRDGHNAYQL